MATTLLALIDDIASVLDDVSLLTKVAARKTASVLGDDLALNAEQVAGVRANRELPVVWAVARGSLRNKAILVPTALLISALAPWAIMPLLMLGGLYLCFEGFEKVAHKFFHPAAEQEVHQAELSAALRDPEVDFATLERDKIKGAVRTDFILSAEIIVITLGTVADANFLTQVLVLIGIAILMTVGVYGLVAGIVRLDDAGALLARREGESLAVRLQRRLGHLVLALAPWLMRVLSVAGTIAMFLVGGGIIVHGLPGMHGVSHQLAEILHHLPGIGGLLHVLAPLLLDALIGVLAGALVLAGVNRFQRWRGGLTAAA
jgi:predicted DNA repair protein MutK